MLLALLILGLLSVGSIVFFARLALVDSLRRGINVEPYRFPDILMLGVVVYIFLPGALLTMAGQVVPPIYTRPMILQGIIITMALITLIMGVLVGRWLNPLDLFGLRGRSPKVILATAGTSFLAVLPLVFFALLLSQYLLGRPSEQPLMLYLRTHSGWADLLPLIVTAVIVAPISEEIIFRGYVYGVVRHYAGRWCGLLFSAVFFAAIHGHVPSLIPLFLLAVCLQLAYEYSGSLWTTMLMHAGFNSLNIIVALRWPELG
ncbi:hypothetical protein BH09VER1_BH09VER1_11630 [soil metagenome]